MEDVKTKGVEMLLGNPKKAVIAMSVPMIVALVAQSVNNLVDAVWVSGLGTNALAAVGFVFPLFFILIGVGNGIGVGASSAIGRHIGRGDKDKVDRVASQGTLLCIVLSIVATIPLLVFQKDIMVILGAGDTMKECIEYSTPIFATSVIILVNCYLSMTLRAEGASKRAMYTQVLAAAINIILDPLFIYSDFLGQVFGIDIGIHIGLGMGIAGAAWATIVAVSISLAIILFWYFIKSDTYAKIKLNLMKLQKDVSFDILRVGVPAMMDLAAMSVFAMAMDAIITTIPGGTDNVAVFSSTFRIIQIIMIPLSAIGGGVVPVLSAAFGAKRYDKMKEAYLFATNLGIAIEVVLVILTEILAPLFVFIFTYSEGTASLKDAMTDALRILCVFLPFASWGFVAVGQFQSMGMGMKSFVCTMVRNGLQIPAAYICIALFGTFTSIMFAIMFSEIIGSLLGGLWSYMLVRKLMADYNPQHSADVT